MNKKFGVFDSVEELNRAAAAQRAEGDIEALMLLAKENGIDQADAEDYADGLVDELATVHMAALGKLSMEEEEMATGKAMEGWVAVIKDACLQEADMAAGVMKKDKTLAGCLGELLKEAFEIKEQLPEKVVKAAGLRPPLYFGVPSNRRTKEIIRQYYTGG